MANAAPRKAGRLDDLLGRDAVAASDVGSEAPKAVAKLLGRVEADEDDASDDDADSGADGSDDEDDGPSMYAELMAAGLAEKKKEAERRRAAEREASKEAFAAPAPAPRGKGGKAKASGSGFFKSGFLNRPRRRAGDASGKAAAAAKPAAASAAPAAKPRPDRAGRAGRSGAPAGPAAVLEPDASGGFDLTREVSVGAVGKAAGGARPGAVLPEVRAAMEAGASAAERVQRDKSWLTKDLMQRIASDPVLAMGFSNPRCQAAIADLQRDPAAAKAKHASDPLVRTFLGRFVELMGSHFTDIGKRETEAKAEAEAKAKAKAEAEARRKAAEAVTPDELARMAREKEIAPDDAEVRSALSDPAVVRAMQDPMVQRCLQVCRAEPHRLPEFLREPRVRRHLDVLRRAGVIGVA